MILVAGLASASLLQALPLAAASLKLQRERQLTDQVWRPNPGGQQMVLDLVERTDVEEIWYLGEAGGGKTYLAEGLAGTHFQNAIFFRRELNDLGGAEGAIERSRQLFGRFGAYNSTAHLWRLLTNGKRRFLEFAGCEREVDKEAHQGRPHDLYVFDEITQFTSTIPAYITGWKRSSDPTQRTLELYLGNPPVSPEGEWVTDKVRPWVDPAHPRPAAPGEIRYFASRKDGTEVEVSGPEPVDIDGDGDVRRPKSRTFVPSVLRENPTYANGDYARTLDAMPEPLRSILMRGDFMASRKDNIWQVIPTAWVKAAQARWRPDGHLGLPQDQVGQDVAHGGADRTVLVPRYGVWFGLPQVYPGKATPDGHDAAALLAKLLQPSAFGAIDATGVGASCFDIARGMGLEVRAVLPGAGIDAVPHAARRDRSGKLGMRNLRAAIHWYFRELLDPANGHDVALPPHPQLLADLTAVHWKLTPGGITIDEKSKIKERLGRSPDVGEAVMYAAAPWLISAGGFLPSDETPEEDFEDEGRLDMSSGGGWGDSWT